MNVGAVGKRSRLTWIHPLALACVAVFISSFTIGASTQALAASSSAPAIVIVSHPQMAAILIDGKDSRLSTPAAITSLAPGPHQLSLVIPGFDPWNTSITMPSTGTLNILAGLKVTGDPADAVTLIVTNNSDASNGDVSSISALIANPGPDGISFREALLAANTTPGPKVIGFAPSLKGATITPGEVTDLALPQLLGGDTSIIGDTDGDGLPDITLDGRLGHANGPLGLGLDLWSSNNRISGLQLINFSEPILFAPGSDWTGPTKTLMNNRVLGNSITGDMGVFVGPGGILAPTADSTPGSNLTWDQIMIAGNDIKSPSPIFLYAGVGTSHDNLISNVTIAANWVSGGGIGLYAADGNSAWQQIPGPTLYADHNRAENVTIERNRIDGATVFGILVGVGDEGNSYNVTSDVHILNNQIHMFSPNAGPGGREDGIILSASTEPGPGNGRTSTGNTLQRIEVRNNTITNAKAGIRLAAAENWGSANWTSGPHPVIASTQNTVEDVVIANNVVTVGNVSGAWWWGQAVGILAGASLMENESNPASYNVMKNVTISGNRLRDGTKRGVGIQVTGGLSNRDGTIVSYPLPGAIVSHSTVTGLVISGNVLTGWKTGLFIAGGYGKNATANSLTGKSSGNIITSSTTGFTVVANYGGASKNSLHFTRS